MRKLDATHQPGANRRTFLRSSGSVIAAGVAAAVLGGRDTLAQSATALPANLHDAAPTRFQDPKRR